MQLEPWLEVRDTTVLVHVRVQPRAKKPGLAGNAEGRLRVRVTAPPADGRANAAVVELVATLAGVPRSRVIVSHGHRAREKTLTIATADPGATAARIRAGSCSRGSAAEGTR